MTKKAKTILWSVVSAAAALTFVGVYVFRHKKATPAKTSTTTPTPASTAPTSSATAPKQYATTIASSVNLRTGAATSTPSVLQVDNHTYLGTVTGIYPDADGKKDASGKLYQWANINPGDALGIEDPFYVRTDLVMIS